MKSELNKHILDELQGIDISVEHCGIYSAIILLVDSHDGTQLMEEKMLAMGDIKTNGHR